MYWQINFVRLEKIYCVIHDSALVDLLTDYYEMIFYFYYYNVIS